MKYKLAFLFLLHPLVLSADYWTPKANYPGIGLGFSVCFSINSMGYVGCGFDSMIGNWTHKDFWEFDPSNNVWTQKADFGGISRGMAVSFSVGNIGYVGIGFTQGNGALQDFWEYNPSTNMWTQKANFGGGKRFDAIGFSIGNMGYVGFGVNSSGNYFNDLWQYNPLNDTWTQKTNCPGAARARANSFVIGSDAYLVGGIGVTSYTDLWLYNSLTDAWLQKANFPSSYRTYAASFSICGKGFYGTGLGGSFMNDFWQYDPTGNFWTQKTSFSGVPRSGTSFFTINSKGFVGLGYHSDFYEYTPDSTCTTALNEINLPRFNVFPNPFDEILNLNVSGSGFSEIIIYDINMKFILRRKFVRSISIQTKQFINGVYLYELKQQEGFSANGKILKIE